MTRQRSEPPQVDSGDGQELSVRERHSDANLDGKEVVERRPDIVSEELVSAVLRHERFAVNEFGRKVLPLIRGTVHRTLSSCGAGSDTLTEDVTNDVFVLLFTEDCRALRKWKPELGGSLRRFLVVFARMRTLDRLRAHVRGFPKTDLVLVEDLAVLASADPDLFEQTLRRHWLREMWSRLESRLSERQKLLLELTLKDASGADIAEALATTSANVFTLRKRLRETLLQISYEIFGEGLPLLDVDDAAKGPSESAKKPVNSR